MNGQDSPLTVAGAASALRDPMDRTHRIPSWLQIEQNLKNHEQIEVRSLRRSSQKGCRPLMCRRMACRTMWANHVGRVAKADLGPCPQNHACRRAAAQDDDRQGRGSSACPQYGQVHRVGSFATVCQVSNHLETVKSPSQSSLSDFGTAIARINTQSMTTAVRNSTAHSSPCLAYERSCFRPTIIGRAGHHDSRPTQTKISHLHR